MVPRVTEILKPFSGFKYVSKDILEKAAARGTKVHSICAGIANGAWIPDGMIPEELLGYVNSFKQWAKAQVEEFVIVEKRYSDDVMCYNGQLDFVIKGIDGALYLADLKTSSTANKTYPIQMAAYNSLLHIHDIKVKSALLVYLSKDGEFPEIQTIEDMTEEMQVFRSALDCWHYFNKGKKNDRKRT